MLDQQQGTAPDVVERLRAYVDSLIIPDEEVTNGLMAEAATTIASLREQLHYANGTCDLAMRDRDAAESRVSVLEGALKQVAAFGDMNLSSEWEHGLRAIIRSVIDCAKEALRSLPVNAGSTSSDGAEESAERGIVSANRMGFESPLAQRTQREVASRPSETLSPSTVRVADREAIARLSYNCEPAVFFRFGRPDETIPWDAAASWHKTKHYELADAILSLLDKGGGNISDKPFDVMETFGPDYADSFERGGTRSEESEG